MRRSIAALALVALLLAGCGDDDGEAGSTTTSSTTAAETTAPPEAGALAACGPLATIQSLFGELEEQARSDEPNQIAADATLEAAVEQLGEAVPDDDAELSAAVETLGRTRFRPSDDAGPVPSRDQVDAALATLDAEYGPSCR